MTEAHGTPLDRASDGLSIAKVAERIGVHHQTVRNWIKAGTLPATRFGPSGGIIRVHPDDVAKLRQPPPT